MKQLFKRIWHQKETGNQYTCVGVLLENGEIHVICSDDQSKASSWNINQDYEDTKIDGKIMCFSPDPVQYKCHLFLAKVEVAMDNEETENFDSDNADEYGDELGSLEGSDPEQMEGGEGLNIETGIAMTEDIVRKDMDDFVNQSENN